MSFLDFLDKKKATTDKFNSRTPDSVSNEVLEALVNNKLISGDQDFGQALIKMTRASLQDAELASAINTVSEKMLALFPNETSEPAQQTAPATEGDTTETVGESSGTQTQSATAEGTATTETETAESSDTETGTEEN